MRPILLFVLFLTSNLYGQDTKRVTVETTLPVYTKEEYYVLKSDKSIKHGEYVRYGWSRVIGEKGQYEMNQRVGIWEFYNSKGELEQRYNYTEKKMELIRPSEFQYKILTEVNGVYEDRLPDELPVFIGGQYRQSYFVLTLKYPAAARKKGIEGKVFISAIITKEGKMIEEAVETGIEDSCDEEALNAIKRIPDDWISAKVNGEPVNVKISIPVTFRLGY